MKIDVSKFFGLISTGLLAGAFLYGLLNIVPTFYEVPITVHLTFRTRLMNHNSMTMQALMALSVVSPIWYAMTHKKVKMVVAVALLSSVLALTSLLVTRFGNVPINQLIKTWSAERLPDNWTLLLRRWDNFNLIRALAGLGSFLAFILTTHLSLLRKSNLSLPREIKALNAEVVQ